MKFLLDESADFRLGTYLAELGHDVTAISREYPQALLDEEVLALAYREQRILITRDRGFGELIYRHHHKHAGVILVRFGAAQLTEAQQALALVISEHIEMVHHFVVVSERSIRIRRSFQDHS